jgi:hypothetical protein
MRGVTERERAMELRDRAMELRDRAVKLPLRIDNFQESRAGRGQVGTGGAGFLNDDGYGFRYSPRPAFPGDDWTFLRNLMADVWTDHARMIASQVAADYLRAAKILGAKHDPVALLLQADKRYDALQLSWATAHPGAYWRKENGYLTAQKMRASHIERLVFYDFHDWLKKQIWVWWIDNPLLVRRAAIVVARWDRPNFFEYEQALMAAMTEAYPLPRPDTDDLFDNPARFSPYPDAEK